MSNFFFNYGVRLKQAFDSVDVKQIVKLADSVNQVWKQHRRVFVCGNGGSAANANHIANDWLYGIDKPAGMGVAVESLSANVAVMTCLANDTGYENIYSHQLKVKASSGDLLIVLSGSGNSANVVNALTIAKELGVTTSAILGYSGGKCKEIADIPIHFAIDDMQISEDLQLSVAHMVMQYLNTLKKNQSAQKLA